MQEFHDVGCRENEKSLILFSSSTKCFAYSVLDKWILKTMQFYNNPDVHKVKEKRKKKYILYSQNSVHVIIAASQFTGCII